MYPSLAIEGRTKIMAKTGGGNRTPKAKESKNHLRKKKTCMGWIKSLHAKKKYRRRKTLWLLFSEHANRRMSLSVRREPKKKKKRKIEGKSHVRGAVEKTYVFDPNEKGRFRNHGGHSFLTPLDPPPPLSLFLGRILSSLSFSLPDIRRKNRVKSVICLLYFE